ncbi:MAG: acyl-CoA reductase [Bacteroidales bacterium]|nr:acyl-CoA reductase [Bacteroidales bacterium]
MYQQVFIDSFSLLGELLSDYLNGGKSNPLLDKAIEKTYAQNQLFTPYMQKRSLEAITCEFLQKKILESWLEEFSSSIKERELIVGIIMAGNLPLVGFHDFLTVMASGSKAIVKSSSKDPFLIVALTELLCSFNEYWRDRVSVCNTPPANIDMVIATGSESTAKHFDMYYGNIPKLIRGSRYSFAVLTGEESLEDLKMLSEDMFLYHGMGCRSVSTLFVPKDFNLKNFAKRLSEFCMLKDNEYYMDSYRYQRAIAQMSGVEFFDGGSFILMKSIAPPPPMSVVAIFEYEQTEEVINYYLNNTNSIQCAVNFNMGEHKTNLGKSQFPRVDDYADGINSLEFILKNS